MSQQWRCSEEGSRRNINAGTVYETACTVVKDFKGDRRRVQWQKTKGKDRTAKRKEMKDGRRSRQRFEAIGNMKWECLLTSGLN